MTKKLDMRYGRNRAIARATMEVGPPPMYRADLLRAARNQDQSSNSEFRNLAAALSLSVNTIRDAMAGNATKIETLWILARHFEIPWLQLFDNNNQLEFVNGKPTAIRGLVRRAKK